MGLTRGLEELSEMKEMFSILTGLDYTEVHTGQNCLDSTLWSVHFITHESDLLRGGTLYTENAL